MCLISTGLTTASTLYFETLHSGRHTHAHTHFLGSLLQAQTRLLRTIHWGVLSVDGFRKFPLHAFPYFPQHLLGYFVLVLRRGASLLWFSHQDKAMWKCLRRGKKKKITRVYVSSCFLVHCLGDSSEPNASPDQRVVSARRIISSQADHFCSNDNDCRFLEAYCTYPQGRCR